MAIQVSKKKLEAMQASFPITPLPKRYESVPVPPLEINVDKIANAITVALGSHRVDLAQTMHEFSAAIAQLRPNVGWTGNWNVTITKRDALGRISEVQFKPAKP